MRTRHEKATERCASCGSRRVRVEIERREFRQWWLSSYLACPACSAVGSLAWLRRAIRLVDARLVSVEGKPVAA